jgi:hypothetical protein
MEDEPWSEFAGVREDQNPHPLTQVELARMLRGFDIRSRTVFPLGGRESRGRSASGYRRDQFEDAWASYCREDEPAEERKPAGDTSDMLPSKLREPAGPRKKKPATTTRVVKRKPSRPAARKVKRPARRKK